MWAYVTENSYALCQLYSLRLNGLEYFVKCYVFSTYWVWSSVRPKNLFFKCKTKILLLRVKRVLRFFAPLERWLDQIRTCSFLLPRSSVSALLKWFFSRFKLGVRYISARLSFCAGCFYFVPFYLFQCKMQKNNAISNTFHGADSHSDSLSASTFAISRWPFHQFRNV